MKIFLLALLILVAASSAMAQFQVSGTVVNAETGQPMQGASVFAQNTTIGTATNSDGHFRLILPDGGYELAISFTGFQTDTKRISLSDAGQSISISLKPKEKELQAVAVVASNEVKDGWERYGSFFLEHFIGKTDNSRHCSIRNSNNLKFFFSKKRNRLKVMSEEPVIIDNNALGYTIQYALDSFVHEYDTDISIYTGYPLFEEMATTDEGQTERWVQARKKAYKGSILHFMRSLYNQSLSEEGFEIQFIVKEKKGDTAIRVKNFYTALNYQKEDSLQWVSVRPNQQNLAVLYTHEKPSAGYLVANPGEPTAFQFSVLAFLPGESLYIEQNGFYYEQNDITIRHYWTWDKVADMLPYNYVSD